MTKKKDPYLIDEESPKWTDKMFSNAKPTREFFTPEQLEGLMKFRFRGQRGKQKAPVKVPLKIHLDKDVLSGFRAMGRGWQTRINKVLREYLDSLPAK